MGKNVKSLDFFFFIYSPSNKSVRRSKFATPVLVNILSGHLPIQLMRKHKRRGNLP